MAIGAALSVAAGLLKLANAAMARAERRSQVEAGMAKAFRKGTETSLEAINDAMEVAKFVDDNPDSEYVKRLRDKYTKR